MMLVPVGPMAIPVGALLLLAGVVAALLIDTWLHRRGRASAEAALWWLLLAGVVVARVVFVLRWWPQYAGHPLTIIDLRDGGWSPWAGLAVIGVGAVWMGWRRRRLREPLAWALLGGLLVWGLGNMVAWRLAEASHAPLPALVLQRLDGQAEPLQQLRGRATVINLWATWCGPCRAEMPVLAGAQRSRSQVRFVFANQGESRATIRTFLADTGLEIDNVLLDPFSRLSQHFGVRGYPTTLFFDAQGNLRSIHAGQLSPATLAAELRHVVPGAATAPALPGAPP